MDEKYQKHNQKMAALKKHFKKLKLIAIFIAVAFNVAVDALAFVFASMEVIVFTIIIALILSVMVLFNYLNRLDKIRIAQETQLIEESPLGKMKL